MWSVTLHSKHPALSVKFIILLSVHCTSLHTMHLINTYKVMRSHQAHKPKICFCCQVLSFFENTADYLHSFAYSDKDRKVRIKKILAACITPFPLFPVFSWVWALFFLLFLCLVLCFRTWFSSFKTKLFPFIKTMPCRCHFLPNSILLILCDT